MVKPFWAILTAAAALGATTAAGIVLLASTSGSEQAVRVQQSASPSALPTPTTSPRPRSSPTSATTATPALLSPAPTPAPGGQAPGGCVSGELAYQNPAGRFAFCYPADMQLDTDAGSASNLYGTAVSVRYPKEGDEDLLRAGLYWESTPSIDGRPCTSGEFIVKKERVEPFVISGLSGNACFQDRRTPDQLELTWRQDTRVEVPLPKGGYAVVDITYAPSFTRAGRTVDEMISRFFQSTLLD